MDNIESGIYHLIIYLKNSQNIQIGKLGKFHFPKGYYIYTGSAMNGLKKRIERHIRKEKKLHWHIDYLLEHAQVVEVVTNPTNKRLECECNQIIVNMPNSKIIVPKFGSSDCSKCDSHLVYFEHKPVLSNLY